MDTPETEQTNESGISAKKYRVYETVTVVGGFAQTKSEVQTWYDIVILGDAPVPEGAVELPDDEGKDNNNGNDK